MYDTLHLWLDRADVSGGNPFGLLPCLANQTEHKSEIRGTYHTGQLGSLMVSLFPSGVSIRGSLAKYFLGGNVEALTRRATQGAIVQISDALHTDIGLAKVKRLDIGTNAFVRHQPSEYFPLLGDKPRFKRVLAVDGETLYYRQGKQVLTFYDKQREARAKGGQIPDTLIGMNLLRFELRIMKNVSEQLGTEVTAQTLYDEEFYNSLAKRLHAEFKSIKKNREQMQVGKMRNPSELKDAFLAKRVKEMGMTPDGFIKWLQGQEVFADPKYYTRLKADLTETMTTSHLSKQSDLIRELDTAFYDRTQYAR